MAGRGPQPVFIIPPGFGPPPPYAPPPYAPPPYAPPPYAPPGYAPPGYGPPPGHVNAQARFPPPPESSSDGESVSTVDVPYVPPNVNAYGPPPPGAPQPNGLPHPSHFFIHPAARVGPQAQFDPQRDVVIIDAVPRPPAPGRAPGRAPNPPPADGSTAYHEQERQKARREARRIKRYFDDSRQFTYEGLVGSGLSGVACKIKMERSLRPGWLGGRPSQRFVIKRPFSHGQDKSLKHEISLLRVRRNVVS